MDSMTACSPADSAMSATDDGVEHPIAGVETLRIRMTKNATRANGFFMDLVCTAKLKKQTPGHGFISATAEPD